MRARTVAVIEDEVAIASAIAARLRKEGFTVDTAADGPSGIELCARIKPDLVILDLMLPGFDGLEVCRRIQRERHLPVLMLTARDSETDMLVGLGVGADDYMTKPFSTRELVARVHVLLRRVDRAPSPNGDALAIEDLAIDPGRREVKLAGTVVHLTPIEFDLLYKLAARPGIVYSRDQLLSDVWGYTDDGSARTVDSHIGALRRKLGAEWIRTAHGVGYAFKDPA